MGNKGNKVLALLYGDPVVCEECGGRNRRVEGAGGEVWYWCGDSGCGLYGNWIEAKERVEKVCVNWEVFAHGSR